MFYNGVYLFMMYCIQYSIVKSVITDKINILEFYFIFF